MFFIISILVPLTSIKPSDAEEPKNSPTYVITRLKPYENIYTEDIAVFRTSWVDSLKLILPCKNVPVPKRTMRLPNAPRSYRSGIHRGVDFFANWGTPVRVVADGIIIRADHHYEEVSASFREDLLEVSGKIGNTPSDIFNEILLGMSVFVDHGLEIIPGFRTISIYAHLSFIEKRIEPGIAISGGDIIGRSGNSGMRESTLGSKAGSHLHWEMILQNSEGEIFLGQGIKNPDLYEMLNNIFVIKQGD